MNRYICIHGHFYQPPRENPWLEEIELQESAHPYHDWNERITAECYAPNTASRIFDPEGRIVDIVNNYAEISFDFSPTLLSWMEKHAPEVYRAIIEADAEGRRKFAGHGPALAQAYNHIIMPLADLRDKRTQIIWGIKDFKRRFGREPEGLWIPETAVDLETLDLMAEHGIKFTILAPRQAWRIRKIGSEEWTDVSGEKIDFRMPYLCRLSSGRTITLFFYNEPISHAVAFERLLDNGEAFAKRLLDAFSEDGGRLQLVHIATDGESYGHHTPFGDMALAYCLRHIESGGHAKITVYGEYLEKCPPTHEVEIIENSSWGCAHGIERWRTDCGCRPGVNPGWNQRWRAPLREAMDQLKNSLSSIYEKETADYFRDPWAARDDYIEVILDRSAQNLERFFTKHANRKLSNQEKVRALKLLEMQRHAMLMHTSCGWFFDDISELSPVQIMLYAARAIQLAKETSGANLEPSFIETLGRAPSNISDFKDGAGVYEKLVKPAVVDLLTVGVNHALRSLFEGYEKIAKFYCYTIKTEMCDFVEAGRRKLAIGKMRVYSNITSEESIACFAALYLGNQTLLGGARRFEGDDPFSALRREIRNAFSKGDVSELTHLMSKNFTQTCSLWQLFEDERKQILERIIEPTLSEMETLFRHMYGRYSPTMRVMKEMGIPLPKNIAAAMEFTLNATLRKSLKNGEFNRAQELIEEMRSWSFEPDKPALGFLATRKVDALLGKFSKTPEDISLLKSIGSTLEILNSLNLEVNFWKAQNIYFSISRRLHEQMRERAEKGDESAKEWIARFNALGDYLKVKGT
jgi:alpha-amylase/alpha-mannosidase (GH57 family)